ncbi:hypothetical protein [Limimaricola cinnabarinus]|nr:hypothetical protein [Limimaricola cinnabarinus]
MSKTMITPLMLQVGAYGRAEPHVPVSIDSDLAKKLVETGRWVEGKSKVARQREAVAARIAEEKAAIEQAEADQAAAAETAAAEKAEADRAAAEKAALEKQKATKPGNGAAAS